MKVTNMINTYGNKVANQFIVTGENGLGYFEIFQSYDSTIAKIQYTSTRKLDSAKTVKIDKNYWDYSNTTGKYRNQFLNEDKKATQKKIDSGEYILTDLNG